MTDLHLETAMKMFKEPAKNITDNMRRKAKAVNFGIMYGGNPFRFMAQENMKLTGNKYRATRRMIKKYKRKLENVRSI